MLINTGWYNTFIQNNLIFFNDNVSVFSDIMKYPNFSILQHCCSMCVGLGTENKHQINNKKKIIFY